MNFLEKAWNKQAWWLRLLWPLSQVFNLVAAVRKSALQAKSRRLKSAVPVIVIGNIAIGGTGKTPLVIYLAKYLRKQGFKPGIISRGYKSKAPVYPFAVTPDSDVREVGDEALLVAQQTACPMVIGADRVTARDALLERYACNVVLSDDGLQHYALARDMEILVVDGQRLFSNGFTLPAGPLREPVSRTRSVDHVVINRGISDANDHDTIPRLPNTWITMQLQPKFLVNLQTGKKKAFGVAPFKIGDRIQAVTGIGNPQRFYSLLQTLPYQLECFSFPDHHAFAPDDFKRRGIDDSHPVVMTEKDAVKCRSFAKENYWYLTVEVEVPLQFRKQLVDEIRILVENSQEN